MNDDSAPSMADIRAFSSFDREIRIDGSAPEAIEARILDTINTSLASTEALVRTQFESPGLPALIITGCPRSGTTLLSQLVPRRYDFGHVSNLMARFYNAPATGAWLQKTSMGDEIIRQESFSSYFGETRLVHEPHEFGYFWARHLYSSGADHHPSGDLDLQQLSVELDAMACVLGRPMAMKCTLAPFYLEQVFSQTDCFVVSIHRQQEATVRSIIKARENRLGNPHQWWSIRPKGWDKLEGQPPLQQVRWQYQQVNDALGASAQRHPDRHHTLNLEDLTNDPEQTLTTLMETYARYSGQLPRQVGGALRPMRALPGG